MPRALLASIDANEARIEGDVDWVTALINGEPVDDVHCDDCEAP